MNPNILVIVIDGLREDKAYGKTKTSHTPYLNSLIENGAYFNQAISCSDGTRTCLGCIFTAQYPFQSGLTTFSNHSKSKRFFNFFKKYGYSAFATVPDVDLWKTLTENFEGKDLYEKPYVYLPGGTGNQILDRLELIKHSEPWIYYIHIMDLHRSVNFAIPENFKNEKYGSNDYERMVSVIDFWLGKILQKIDLNRTLVVITSDHGEFIPTDKVGHELTYIPNLVNFSKKLKNVIPNSLEPIGVKVFLFLRRISLKFYAAKLRQTLSEDEMRTLRVRGTKPHWEFYDEVVKTPLIFSGYGIKSHKVISQQVRQIDIFPTIMELAGLSDIDETIQGKSLLPLIKGQKMAEEPAVMENQKLDPKNEMIAIGIRTPYYKYFRDQDDKKNTRHLFDLKNDPNEKNNIAEQRPDLVKKMENLLVELRQNETSYTNSEDDETISKIREELKRLGYV